jgi:hypothetical protein
MFVLPTMSRPQQCAQVLQRIWKSGCTSKGIVFVNGQSHADEYRTEFSKIGILPDFWQVIYHPENIGALAALNKVFEIYPDEDWYGFIADDEMLSEDSPKNWDQRLIAAAGRWGIAHAWEPWNNGRRCQGYPVLGGKLVRAVGYLALPTCHHNFGFDSMWDWLNGAEPFGGGGLHNMKCLPEIKVQHNRAKSDLVLDDCYRLADSKMEDDRKRFWDWMVKDMKVIAKRVREQMALDNAAK